MTDIDALLALRDKITPGPWRVEENTTVIWSTNCYDEGTNNIGCIVARSAQPISCKYSRPTVDEQIVNARAIAAVPDMLDALAKMRTALEPFAKLAGPLVDDGADVAIGLRDEHFIAARTACFMSGSSIGSVIKEIDDALAAVPVENMPAPDEVEEDTKPTEAIVKAAALLDQHFPPVPSRLIPKPLTVEQLARLLCYERGAPACDCKQQGILCKAPTENLLHESNPIRYQAEAVAKFIRPVPEQSIPTPTGEAQS